jgi:hypothetical protein
MDRAKKEEWETRMREQGRENKRPLPLSGHVADSGSGPFPSDNDFAKSKT